MWALRKSRNGPLRCIQDTNCPTFFGLYTSKRIFDQEKVEQHSFDQEKVEQKKGYQENFFSKQNKNLPRDIVSHHQTDHTSNFVLFQRFMMQQFFFFLFFSTTLQTHINMNKNIIRKNYKQFETKLSNNYSLNKNSFFFIKKLKLRFFISQAGPTLSPTDYLNSLSVRNLKYNSKDYKHE